MFLLATNSIPSAMSAAICSLLSLVSLGVFCKKCFRFPPSQKLYMIQTRSPLVQAPMNLTIL